MLYKGIFWIKDMDNLSQSMICAMIHCNKNGDIIDSNIDISALGKSVIIIIISYTGANYQIK